MSNLTPQQIKSFQQIVLGYFSQYGRNMPWRENLSPYSILVSEVMLQQTQVDRVIPKYEQFLKAFPDFSSLTKTSVADVLKNWQGLGYNRRALFLKRTE